MHADLTILPSHGDVGGCRSHLQVADQHALEEGGKRGSGHFNLAQGVVATAVGIGAAFSTTLAGYTVDAPGYRAAFLLLMSVGAVGFLLVMAAMPETKPRRIPVATRRAAVQ